MGEERLPWRVPGRTPVTSDNVYSGANAESDAKGIDGTTSETGDTPWVALALDPAKFGDPGCDNCGTDDPVQWNLFAQPSYVLYGVRGGSTELRRCGRPECDPNRVATRRPADAPVAGRDTARGAPRARSTFPPPAGDDLADGGVATHLDPDTRPDIEIASLFAGPDLDTLRLSVANALRTAEHAMSLATLVNPTQADIWGPRLVTVLERLERATVDALTVVRCELNLSALDARARQ